MLLKNNTEFFTLTNAFYDEERTTFFPTRTQDLFHLINESNADQASQDVLAQTGDSGY